MEQKASSAPILRQFSMVNIFSTYFCKTDFKIILQCTPSSLQWHFFPQDFTVRRLHAFLFLPWVLDVQSTWSSINHISLGEGTKLLGWVGSAPASCSKGLGSISAWRLHILTEVFHDFPQSLQKNTMDVSQTGHKCCLPIIEDSSNHVMLYNMSYWRQHKIKNK
jgi:hypothetical protein